MHYTYFLAKESMLKSRNCLADTGGDCASRRDVQSHRAAIDFSDFSTSLGARGVDKLVRAHAISGHSEYCRYPNSCFTDH
jgi:hypothetical protein